MSTDDIPLHEERIDIPVTCLQMVMSPFSPIVLQAPKSGATQSLAGQPRCSSQSTSSRNSRRRCLARFCTFTPWTSHTETSNLKTSCLRSLSLYIYVGARRGADGSAFEGGEIKMIDLIFYFFIFCQARAEDLDGSPFEGGEIKMIDFGFSKKFHGTEEMHQMMGSLRPHTLVA